MKIDSYSTLSGVRQERFATLCRSVADLFAKEGYQRTELPVMHPAALYLDRAGEDVRQRMYIITREDGSEWALRADLTVPVCRQLIEGGALTSPTRVASEGPCFRAQPADSPLPAEFYQTGAELIGGTDKAAADKEIVQLARSALANAGLKKLRAELGNIALFDAFVDGLGMAEEWRARLSRAFRHPSRLPKVLAFLEQETPGEATAQGASQNDSLLVEQVLSHAKIDIVGRRTIEEIRERLSVKAREAITPKPGREKIALVRALLSIEGPVEDVFLQLDKLAGETGPAFAAALAQTRACVEGFGAIWQPGDEVSFSATLGRKFNYYTGFSFNLWAEGIPAPIASGGRYDTLLAELGADQDVPAVGVAAWPERVLAALEASK